MAWCGQAALARPAPLRVSGAALGGPHGAVYFPSGTKGQQPLVFPALAGLRGRAAAPTDLRRALGASALVPLPAICRVEDLVQAIERLGGVGKVAG